MSLDLQKNFIEKNDPKMSMIFNFKMAEDHVTYSVALTNYQTSMCVDCVGVNGMAVCVVVSEEKILKGMHRQSVKFACQNFQRPLLAKRLDIEEWRNRLNFRPC